MSGHEAAIYSLCLWEGGVLSGGGDGWIVHWEPGRSVHGQLLAKIDDRVFCLLPVNPPGLSAKLVAGTLSGDLYWIDPDQADAPRRWRLHQDGIYDLHANGSLLYVAGGKGRLSSWDVSTGELNQVVQLDTVRLRSISYLEIPGLLAVGTANGDIHLVEPQQLRIVQTLPIAHERTVFSLVDGGTCFYSAGRDGAIRAWSTAAPFGQLAHVAAHAATVNQLGLQGGTLFSVGRDRELRTWSTGQEPTMLHLAKVYTAIRDGGHVASINACCLMPDGIVTAGDDRTLRWWPVLA